MYTPAIAYTIPGMDHIIAKCLTTENDFRNLERLIALIVHVLFL